MHIYINIKLLIETFLPSNTKGLPCIYELSNDYKLNIFRIKSNFNNCFKKLHKNQLQQTS